MIRYTMCALVAALGLTSGAAAQGSVIVLDAQAGPGSDFSSVLDAVTAASPGDTLLVRSGDYGILVFNAKPLTVVADEGHAVSFNGSAIVLNIDAESEVLVSGLRVRPPDGAIGSGVFDLRLSTGPIWLQGCRADRVVINQATKTALVDAALSSEAPGTGINAFGSNLAVYSTDVLAGDGLDAGFDFKLMAPTPGGSGANGLTATLGAQVFVSGSSFAGGDGGLGGDGLGGGPCSVGGDAGSGLAVLATDVASYTQASSFGPGLAGAGGVGCADGAAGQAQRLVPGAPAPVDVGGEARALLADKRVAREGETLGLEFVGRPGDTAFLLFGFDQGHEFLLKFRGTLLQQNFVVFPPPLPMNATGALQLSVAVPELGPGVEALNLYLTPLFVDPGLAKFLGAPTAVVLLDDSF